MMDGVACLSGRCSKGNKCFAASVGMAAKCLMYWGKILLLIGNGSCWAGAQTGGLIDLHLLMPLGASIYSGLEREEDC